MTALGHIRPNLTLEHAANGLSAEFHLLGNGVPIHAGSSQLPDVSDEGLIELGMAFHRRSVIGEPMLAAKRPILIAGETEPMRLVPAVSTATNATSFIVASPATVRQGAVKTRMLARANDLKILNRVVERIPISMVDMLIRFQSAAEVLLNDMPVFRDEATCGPGDVNTNVSLMDVAPTSALLYRLLARAVFRAKAALAFGNTICPGPKRRAAVLADSLNFAGGWRKIAVHWTLLTSDAMPRAVPAAPGLLGALNYSKNGR